MSDKDFKKYLNDINACLVCSRRKKKLILEDIEASIKDYIENENTTNISEIYNHFGSPKDIAKTYIANFVEPTDIKKALDKKKVLIFGVAVALAIWGLVGFLAWLDAHDDPVIIVHGSAIEAEETIDVRNESYEVIS